MAQHPEQARSWLTLLAPAQLSISRQIEEHTPAVELPDQHRALLRALGAAATGDGLTRLFGLSRSGDLPSIAEWNATTTWRFAWPDAVRGWTFIGETAWGDQYAYSSRDLSLADPPIYRLSGDTMNPSQVARNLGEFIEAIFYLFERFPDDYAVAATSAFGRVDLALHIASIPPALIADIPNPELHLVPSRSHMIMNGDVFRQLSANPGRVVSSMLITSEGDIDRVKLEWA